MYIKVYQWSKTIWMAQSFIVWLQNTHWFRIWHSTLYILKNFNRKLKLTFAFYEYSWIIITHFCSLCDRKFKYNFFLSSQQSNSWTWKISPSMPCNNLWKIFWKKICINSTFENGSLPTLWRSSICYRYQWSIFKHFRRRWKWLSKICDVGPLFTCQWYILNVFTRNYGTSSVW